MASVYFTTTKMALDNITSTFDMVWPTAVGLWNLRCMVNGIVHEYPNITESELASKFSVGSGIRYNNYRRIFVDVTWKEQQAKFAWILLNSTVSIFEGWLDELKQSYFPFMDTKNLQFPNSIQAEVIRLTTPQSVMLSHCFYPVYLGRKNRCYNHIIALMHCYRVFKEARNCYIHHSSRANQRLVNAYNDYLPYASTTHLCVQEVPEFPTPVIG